MGRESRATVAPSPSIEGQGAPWFWVAVALGLLGLTLRYFSWGPHAVRQLSPSPSPSGIVGGARPTRPLSSQPSRGEGGGTHPPRRESPRRRAFRMPRRMCLLRTRPQRRRPLLSTRRRSTSPAFRPPPVPRPRSGRACPPGGSRGPLPAGPSRSVPASPPRRMRPEAGAGLVAGRAPPGSLQKDLETVLASAKLSEYPCQGANLESRRGWNGVAEVARKIAWWVAAFSFVFVVLATTGCGGGGGGTGGGPGTLTLSDPPVTSSSSSSSSSSGGTE